MVRLHTDPVHTNVGDKHLQTVFTSYPIGFENEQAAKAKKQKKDVGSLPLNALAAGL